MEAYGDGTVLWPGSGGGGRVVYQTITLAWHNTVKEDGGRSAQVSSSGALLQPGAQWLLTMTNTAHDPKCYTQDLVLAGGGGGWWGWGTFVSTPGPGPANPGQPPGPPTGYSALPTMTGLFTYTGVPNADFTAYGNGNYDIGPIGVDEAWQFLLQRLTP